MADALPICLLNGVLVPTSEARISPFDRGFLFGDGIYEGVRAIEGRLFEWPAHAARMTGGLAGLRIAFGPERVAELEGVAARLLRDNELDHGEAFLYLAVTRGAAPRSHGFPPAGTPPTVFVSATRLVRRRELRQNPQRQRLALRAGQRQLRGRRRQAAQL